MGSLLRVYIGVGSIWKVMSIGRVIFKSFGGDLVSQLTSIKQGEVVVALSKGRGFVMMLGKHNWLF